MNKHYQRILLFISVFCLAVIPASKSFAQAIDPNFYPLVNSFDFAIVYASAVQTDGKVVIGGLFRGANNYQQFGIARLLPNGKTDESFQPVSVSNGSYSGIIGVVKIQSDRKILVAGGFNSVNGQSRRGIARFNEDGSLDTGFNVQFFSTSTGISAVEIQPDGKYLIAGTFAAGQTNLARLNTDGSLDSSFQNSLPAGNGGATEMRLQPDGKILVSYSIYENNTWKTKLVRLNSNGGADGTFPTVEVIGTGNVSGGSPDIDALVLQPDGKIIIGGSLSSVAGTQKNRLARLNADGSLDNNFTPNADGAVQVMTLQPDGKILLGGIFTQINGTARRSLARLNTDGSLDASLNAAFGVPYAAIYSISLQTDGKIIAGGDFLKIGNTLRYRVARLTASGAVDESFEFVYLGTPGVVSTIARRSDGKIYIAGQFNYINSSTRRQLASLNADGTVDETFVDLGFGDNFGVYKLLVLPDNKVMATGNFFVSGGGQNYSNIARFNTDGSVDTTLPTIFTTGITGYISSMILQPDGKMIVGGNFTELGGTPRNALARINTNGTLDTTFQNNAFNGGSYIDKIAVQPDGKILITGTFTQINGLTRNRIARVNSDGTLDTTFQNGMNGVTNSSTIQPFIYDFAIQNDGRILLAGSFETVNGVMRKNLARLNSDGSLDASFISDTTGTSSGNAVFAVLVRQNGKILVGGNFLTVNGQARRGLAQLNADGSLDSSFPISINSTNSGVYSLVAEPNGNVLVGGNFGLVNSLSRAGVLRIIFNNVKTAFDFDGDGKADVAVFRPSNGAWYLNQSTAGFASLGFGISSDKIVPADYDGDGKTDVAVYRPSNGTWYLNRSSLGFTSVNFGTSEDVPAPADFDGDGKADVAVFRPSNGTWYLLESTNGFVSVQFGQSGDKPVAADYDGDGKADVAVYRSGNWYLNRSQLGFTSINFGNSEDKPNPADFDGDGKADLGVFRPSNGTWYLLQSTNGFVGTQFGANGDQPTAADYDGDGRADIAVYRNGTWYLNRSTQGFVGIGFGSAGDKPAPNAFVQ